MSDPVVSLTGCFMICVTTYLVISKLLKLFTEHSASDSVEVFERLTEAEAKIDKLIRDVEYIYNDIDVLQDSMKQTKASGNDVARDVATLKTALNLKTFNK